jgi:hypothetical protein
MPSHDDDGVMVETLLVFNSKRSVWFRRKPIR